MKCLTVDFSNSRFQLYPCLYLVTGNMVYGENVGFLS